MATLNFSSQCGCQPHTGSGLLPKTVRQTWSNSEAGQTHKRYIKHGQTSCICARLIRLRGGARPRAHFRLRASVVLMLAALSALGITSSKHKASMLCPRRSSARTCAEAAVDLLDLVAKYVHKNITNAVQYHVISTASKTHSHRHVEGGSEARSAALALMRVSGVPLMRNIV